MQHNIYTVFHIDIVLYLLQSIHKYAQSETEVKKQERRRKNHQQSAEEIEAEKNHVKRLKTTCYMHCIPMRLCGSKWKKKRLYNIICVFEVIMDGMKSGPKLKFYLCWFQFLDWVSVCDVVCECK